jgi:SAM-dependent methyltransferase
MTSTNARTDDYPPSSGSYRPEREQHGLTGEAARLADQVALSWNEEERLLRACGVSDSMRIVELGSGCGAYADRLLTAFTDSQVTAIEVRADLAAMSAATNRVHGSRYTVIRASCEDTGLAADGYDVAIARLLFQHLRDPAPTVREAIRYLRPGGRFVAIDVDMGLWGVVEPHIPAIAEIYAKAGAQQRAWGGDRMVGRRLARSLTSAGLVDVRTELFAYDSDDLGIEAFATQLDPARLVPAVCDGLLSVEEYALAQLEHQRFLADASAYVMLVGFFVHGRVPTTPTLGRERP